MSTTHELVHVNHVGISVHDAPASRAFFEEVLGATFHGEFGWPVGSAGADESLALEGTAAHVVLLRTDAAFLELFQFSSPAPRPRAADAPGVSVITWAVDDVAATCAAAEAAGAAVRSDALLCTADSALVQLVAADRWGPRGLVGVQVRVAVPERFVFATQAGSPVALEVVEGGVGDVARPVDIGINHLCVDVASTPQTRARRTDVRWHHAATESSGGLACVCYGTTHDGVLVELLESRSEQAFFSRTRLVHG